MRASNQEREKEIHTSDFRYCSYLNETLFSFFQSETVSRKKVGEYWVDKSLIAKESEVFETMLSGVNNWEESMRFASGSNIDKVITVSDTKRVALEAYLVFCYSGYVPMSAIGQVTTSSHVFTNFVNYESEMYFHEIFFVFQRTAKRPFC